MPNLIEAFLICLLVLGFFLFPWFDRASIKKLVRQQTNQHIDVPKDRLMYRATQAFGFGFGAGAFLAPLALGFSIVEGGVLGGVLASTLGFLIKKLMKKRKALRQSTQGTFSKKQ